MRTCPLNAQRPALVPGPPHGHAAGMRGAVCARPLLPLGQVLLLLLLGQVLLLGGSQGLLPTGAPGGHLGQFEQQLLAMFGLKRRPDPGRDAVVPQYMLELYNSLHEQNQNPGQNPGTLGRNLESSASRANTIRSFHHEESEEELTVLRDRTTQRFVFNLTSIPPEEQVTAGELRVFRSALPGAGLHRVNVYEVLKRTWGSHGEAVTQLLDTRLVERAAAAGWESFDVSPAVWRWAEPEGGANHGLLVEVLHLDGGGAVGRGHVRVSRQLHERPASWPQERPLLVTFSHDGRGRALHRRQRRQAPARPRAHTRKRARAACRRHALYVDFSDVGWNDWIVAPPGYHAFHCQGECPFPLADHLNSSNHAVVQTLVNSVYSSVPRACCVPTELSPISLLYLDEHDKVILKNYQDMVVEGCGCR